MQQTDKQFQFSTETGKYNPFRSFKECSVYPQQNKHRAAFPLASYNVHIKKGLEG